MRDGQSIDINDPLLTLTGKRGTLVARNRVEWIDVPDGYAVFTGTWKVVRGTGDYAGLSGGGRGAGVGLPNGTRSGGSKASSARNELEIRARLTRAPSGLHEGEGDMKRLTFRMKALLVLVGIVAVAATVSLSAPRRSRTTQPVADRPTPS